MEGQAWSKPGERSWPAHLPLSLSLPLSLFIYFPPPLLPPTLIRRPSYFYFVCAAPRCAVLSLSFSLSFVGRKWFMAVPERRFRRGSCAEDRPLLLFILCLSSWSCHFIRHASSLRPPRSRAAVFLRDIPFFMHAIASFTFLTRRNGISVFYRLDYTPSQGVFSPPSKFRYFIMAGRIAFGRIMRQPFITRVVNQFLKYNKQVMSCGVQIHARLSKYDCFKINDSYKLSVEINTTYNDFKMNDSYKLSANIIVFHSNLSQHLYANYSVDLSFHEIILFFLLWYYKMISILILLFFLHFSHIIDV